MISKTLDVLMVAALLAMDSQAADPVKAPHLDMTFKSNDHNGLRGFYPWWSGDLDDSKCRVAETRKWEKGMPEHYWKQQLRRDYAMGYDASTREWRDGYKLPKKLISWDCSSRGTDTVSALKRYSEDPAIDKRKFGFFSPNPVSPLPNYKGPNYGMIGKHLQEGDYTSKRVDSRNDRWNCFSWMEWTDHFGGKHRIEFPENKRDPVSFTIPVKSYQKWEFKTANADVERISFVYPCTWAQVTIHPWKEITNCEWIFCYTKRLHVFDMTCYQPENGGLSGVDVPGYKEAAVALNPFIEKIDPGLVDKINNIGEKTLDPQTFVDVFRTVKASQRLF